jgi:spore germination protein YaaH
MEKNKRLLNHFLLTAIVAACLASASLVGLAGQKPARNKPIAHAAAWHLSAASRRVLASKPLALYYFTGETRGFESIQTHAAEMTVVAPQCHWVEKDGVVRGELPVRLAEISKRAHFPVMPLVYNKGFDRATVTRLLQSPAAQRRAVSYMGYLAARNNYVGFQIDLENIDPADHSRFSQFVRLAADRMHRDGRLLSVAVVPRFSDARPGDGRTGEPLTGEWSAAFDYAALGRVADFLTLMTYDHSGRSGPAGPVAGYGWVKKALDYAVARVPPGKLLLGIPLYGREWVEADNKLTSRSMTAQDVQSLLAEPGIETEWDERWRSPWLEIRTAGTVKTVWYEDQRSWAEKLSLMKEYRLCGFAAWRLGFEGPEFWNLIAIKGEESPKTSRTATVP